MSISRRDALIAGGITAAGLGYLVIRDALNQAFAKEIYIPIVQSAGASWGCQIEGDITGYEKWLVPGMVYQTAARWNGLDEWFDRNVSVLQNVTEKLIIGSRTCPEEYRLWPDFLGSPPKPEFYGKFGEWASAICDQYHPWGFEVWNEPDVPRDYCDPNYFGSWVDTEEYYLAGRSYGNLLAEVCGTIAATGVKVIGGALSNTPGSLDFAQGMVDGGLLCDYVSFHTYVNPDKGETFDKGFDFAQELSTIVSYPLIWNETSIIGDGSPEHEKVKAEYCAYVKSMYAWSDIAILEWYSLWSGWLGTDLITNHEPTPAYEIWRR